jgi:hypothetical protein
MPMLAVVYIRCLVPTSKGTRSRVWKAFGYFESPARVRYVLQQHDELVAAEPGGHVRIPQAPPQALGYLAEHPIPLLVTQGVVYELEVVEVYEQHGDFGAPASRAREGAGEVLVERLLVVEIGEVVVGGFVAQLLLQRLLSGHPPLQFLVALAQPVLGPFAAFGEPTDYHPRRQEDAKPEGFFRSAKQRVVGFEKEVVAPHSR